MNTGALGEFTVNYERDLSLNERLALIVRRELARYEIPNELVQQLGNDRAILVAGGQPDER